MKGMVTSALILGSFFLVLGAGNLIVFAAWMMAVLGGLMAGQPEKGSK